MNEAATITLRNGGIVPLDVLRRAGINKYARAIAVSEGSLVRLRNGWFAVPTADIPRMRAVRLGGRLTCSSLLVQLGLWVMPEERLHVAVHEDATRLRSPDDRRTKWDSAEHPDVCLHWQEFPWDPPVGSVIDSLKSAIAHLIVCANRESAVVTIDSALNTEVNRRPMLAMRDLAEILAQLPAVYAPIFGLVDGRSQSGLETLARLRLRRRGLRVRIQVRITGVGLIDVLIGERLVLELDSRTHHLGENYEKDRSRDLELFRQGFTVIRVSYRRVMYDWKSVEDAVLAAVRRGEHLRRGIHQRNDLATVLD